MVRSRAFAASVVAWAGAWAFWLAATRDFHPTLALAAVVTTALVAAYAAAAYANHYALIPRLRADGRAGRYAAALAAVMVILTSAALAVIRVSYRELWGPDADPNGAYKHFAIDLLGMGVHLLAAAGVAAAARRMGVFRRDRGPAERTPE